MTRCVGRDPLIWSIPDRPLTPTEVERLRASETVEEVVVLESLAETCEHGGAHQALVLANGRLFALCYGRAGWTHELIKENADWVALHDAAFAWFCE